MQNFIKKLLLFSFGISCIIFCWDYFAPEKFYLEDIWFAFVFFIAATTFVHVRILAAEKKRPGLFIRNFMMLTVIKFFVYLIIIVAYCLLKPSSAVAFSSGFLILYFLFSAFEVTALRKHFNR
jgi:predicted transporter